MIQLQTHSIVENPPDDFERWWEAEGGDEEWHIYDKDGALIWHSPNTTPEGEPVAADSGKEDAR